MATQISINLPKHPRKTVAIPFKPTHSPLIQLMINYILAYSRVQSTRHSSQFSKQLIQSVSLRSTRVNPNPLRKMEQIVEELHITDQAIKPKQHCACDLKRQQWHNAGLLVGWLNREWAKTWICSSAALCEKTANIWSRLECLNIWKRTFFRQSSSPEGSPALFSRALRRKQHLHTCKQIPTHLSRQAPP